MYWKGGTCDGQNLKNLKSCFQVLSRQQSRGHQGMTAISRQGHYKKIPMAERICICGSSELENIGHVLFRCPLYAVAPLMLRIIAPLMLRIPGVPEEEKIKMLLIGGNTEVSKQVARYCAIALRIRQISVSTGNWAGALVNWNWYWF